MGGEGEVKDGRRMRALMGGRRECGKVEGERKGD